MTSKELNNKILKIQKLVKQASELKIEQLEKCISNIPSFVGTNLYGDLKNAVILEEKKFITIERLNNILESISSIISCYCFEKYGLDFEVYNTILHFLKENRYHSKEEQQACFQSQLLDNADNWNIYMRDKLTLVNLLNGSQIVLETEERLREYINENQIICIETKFPYFEKEYQKFYNYLLKHGYEYTTGENAAPVSIAKTLANIFNAEVTISKDLLPFYISNFNYPENFNNQRYIDYVQNG